MPHTLGTLRLEDQDLAAVLEVAQSNWLSPGPKVKEFEVAIAKLHNNDFGVMTNSGTDALRIAVCAAKELYGWSDGDKVIVPAVTFVATANVVIQAGLIPVFADVSMYDFNLNPENVLRRFFQDGVDPRIKAILPVHLAGNPADMPKILKIAKEFNLKVIEDSCEALGVPGIGSGDITCFSFYVAHLLTTGVGGMAITRDPILRDLMWSYCNHGRREAKGFVFDRIGFSCRPTEFEAALGLSQLPRLPAILAARKANFQFLFDKLRQFPELRVYYPDRSSYMFFPVLVRESLKPGLMAYLTENGVENRELMPLINQPCYKGLIDPATSYSVAEDANKRGLYIGCHQDLTRADLTQTVNLFKQFFTLQEHRYR